MTPWIAAHQASLSFTVSRNLLRFMSIELVMPSKHLILCYPLLLHSIVPCIRVFSNESVPCIRWPKLLELQLQHHSIFVFLTIISHLAFVIYICILFSFNKENTMSVWDCLQNFKKWLRIVLGFVWVALRFGMSLWIVAMLGLSLRSCHQDRKWEVPWGLCPSFRYNLINAGVGRSP